MAWVLPTSRLVDAMRRNGFDVYSATKYREMPGDDGDVVWTSVERTYWMSRGGKILATARCGPIPSETITYGNDDPTIISIAGRYGSISRGGSVELELTTSIARYGSLSPGGSIDPELSTEEKQAGIRLECARVTSSAVMEVLSRAAGVLLVGGLMLALFWLSFKYR